MPTRMTALFSITTTPPNRSLANPHTGGWSESWWTQLSGSNLDAQFQQLLSLRARMLPASAQIIGSRRSSFTIAGNRLLPGPSQSAEAFYPGMVGNVNDLPQAALQIKGTAAAGPNRNSFYLRAIPDDQIQGGEYDPTRAFNNAVVNFKSFLANGNWGFVGRDLLQPRARVLSIAGGIVQLDGPLGGVAAGSFLRFSRVYGSDGQPIKGSFVVNSFAGALYTCLGLVGKVVLVPSGTARNDLLTYSAYSVLNIGRAGVKKVGRPSEGYRGRRSA